MAGIGVFVGSGGVAVAVDSGVLVGDVVLVFVGNAAGSMAVKVGEGEGAGKGLGALQQPPQVNMDSPMMIARVSAMRAITKLGFRLWSGVRVFFGFIVELAYSAEFTCDTVCL